MSELRNFLGILLAFFMRCILKFIGLQRKLIIKSNISVFIYEFFFNYLFIRYILFYIKIINLKKKDFFISFCNEIYTKANACIISLHIQRYIFPASIFFIQILLASQAFVFAIESYTLFFV